MPDFTAALNHFTNLQQQNPLPIDEVLSDIDQALSQSNNAVLVAQPGAGKTTRVPLQLLAASQQPGHWLHNKRILMLEPRRIATRNAANFMASQLQQPCGQQVGYRLRLENKTSKDTRIEVMTEGTLTRLLQNDPELSDVGLIIFDEFHERNLHSDLGLALAHQCQQLLRDDLRLLIMSATLDEQSLSEALDAEVIYSEGRSFPVEIDYRPFQINGQFVSGQQALAQSRQGFISHLVKVIGEVISDEQNLGDILCFLPGAGEINALSQALSQTLNINNDQLLICPLYGQLSDKAQKIALTKQAQRKIILATNIAESSVTIDGVSIVVDSGLERQMQFQPASGLENLATTAISQASSVQRAGRSGRQQAGHCIRLWAESEQSQRARFLSPDIVRSDLAPLSLELLQWSASAEELFWLTPPPAAALEQAQYLLRQLNIEQTDEALLTAHGKQCAQLGLEPRWAHALITAHSVSSQSAELACDLAAFIQQCPAKNFNSDDIKRELDNARRQPFWQQQIAPLAQRWLKTLSGFSVLKTKSPKANNDLTVAQLIALAFPDRIAQPRSHHSAHGEFILALGQGAQSDEHSPFANLEEDQFLACLQLQNRQRRGHNYAGQNRSGHNHSSRSAGLVIRQAAELSSFELQQLLELQPHWLEDHYQLGWQDNGQLQAEQQQRLGRLIIERKSINTLSSEQWQQAWADYLQEMMRSKGLHALNWSDESKALRQRILLVAESGLLPASENWPDVSEHSLSNQIIEWLLPLLTDARNLRALQKLDLTTTLLNQLDWNQQQLLNELAPTHIQVPSGSRIAIDYSHNPPVLAVKLQEMFGFQGSPAILRGQLPLMIHLLSPAKRPLQVTQDLTAFWANGYNEVRKEMRGRYPKHPWPEDPLNAEATRLTKARMAAQNSKK